MVLHIGMVSYGVVMCSGDAGRFYDGDGWKQ